MAEADEVQYQPPWTEYEFRRYLTCGILAFGFARARCTDCRQERLLAFSCKDRCVCPSRDPFDQSLPGDDGTWSA
jgi:hypothetical protein